MSSDLIRAFRDEDTPAVARIWRELRPDAMHSENGLRHLVGSFPERAQAANWVAENDGASRPQRGTATAAAHRERGLATLAKLAQLRWAAANGIDRVVTDNDERNAPMLAINRRLGYEPFTERRGYLKER